MYKGKRMVTALLALILGLYVASPAVRAQEPVVKPQAEEQVAQLRKAGQRQAEVRTGMISQGSLVYKEKERGAQIYAADFLILKEKLDTIPDTLFEPACYTHAHQWEYRDVSGKTHTRHCEACGDGFDLVRAHKAERREECVFSHDGTEYFGIRYTCVCGYQWEQEKAHTLFFETVGEEGHRSRCRLDGTKFCPGYEPFWEEHYAYYYEPCEDGRHHEKICMDCGYRGEEECFFSLPDVDDEGESSSGGRCWCGNIEKPDVEIGDENTDTETDEENMETMPGEEKPGEESGEENTDAESGEENTDTSAGDEEVETEPEAENVDEKPEEGKAEEMMDGSPNMESEESRPNAEAGLADRAGR
ncbi:MAG: hypothetical protein K2K90_08390 [Lachnospiraceae bacterium]|nr:hypothetical protein [Lachnospiraceae bacterium]